MKSSNPMQKGPSPARTKTEQKTSETIDIKAKIEEYLSENKEIDFALEAMRNMQNVLSEKAKNLLRRRPYLSSK